MFTKTPWIIKPIKYYLLGIVLVFIPGILFALAAFGIPQITLVSFAIITGLIFLEIWYFERLNPQPKDLMPIVVLSAIAIAGRIAFTAIPSFKPVTAIVILTGMIFGPISGLMTGLLSALGSNMFFGQGPWTSWQMYAWGLIGFLSGVLYRGLPKWKWTVFVWGFLSCMLYGFILDSWHTLTYVQPLTWQSALVSYGAGLPFNIVHGIATVTFLLPILVPWGKRLQRIKIKYGLK